MRANEFLFEKFDYLELSKHDKPLLKSNDYTWWLLDKNTCQNNNLKFCEHAPNGERIIALRHSTNKETVPVLVSINNNGVISNVKSNNKKPSKKYHQHIANLLDHNIVKSVQIIDTKNNFNINDLDKKYKNTLLQNKPNLFPLKQQFKNDPQSTIDYIQSTIQNAQYKNTKWYRVFHGKLDSFVITKLNLNGWRNLVNELMENTGWGKNSPPGKHSSHNSVANLTKQLQVSWNNNNAQCLHLAITEIMNDELNNSTKDKQLQFDIDSNFNVTVYAHIDYIVSNAKSHNDSTVNNVIQYISDNLNVNDTSISINHIINQIDYTDLKDCFQNKGF